MPEQHIPNPDNQPFVQSPKELDSSTPFPGASHIEQSVYKTAYNAGKRAWENLQLREENERLNYMATHDDLTGLLNARGLEIAYSKRLEQIRASGINDLLLLFLDGTNFKAVNDTLGHATGDEALIGIASVLRQSTREGDVIARVGGDEFVVIMCAREDEHQPLDVRTQAILTRITEEKEAFLHRNPHIAQTGFDIAVGVASWEEGTDFGQIKSEADAAMMEHKAMQHAKNGQYRRQPEN